MILVTGATGTIGREVVDLLVAAGSEVRGLTRDPGRAHLPDGVDTVRGEPSDRDSLFAALDGVDAVMLVVPGAAPSLGDALKVSGVSKVVLLSSLTAETRPELAYARRLRETEVLVRSAVPDATILHPGQFASNTLWWGPMITEGVIRAPYGDVAIPAIDPSDIAAVAAALLLGGGHLGATLRLSGPELLSPRQKVAQLAEVLERPLDFVELTDAQFRAASPQMGPDLHDYFLALTGSPKADELTVTHTVEDLTGRAPRTFREWAANNVGGLTGA